MKYALVTFGCRVNQADSMRIEEALRAGGGQSSDPDSADVVIVNTCTVTANADQGARQTIRRITRSNPRARLVVTGCYATRMAAEVRGLPGVWRVEPNDRKDGLGESIARSFGLTTAERFGSGEGPCGSTFEPGLGGRTTFTLRVQTGCEEACSYCIIPSTRGSGRSLSVLEVVDTIERAVDAGFNEVVLTGVHLGSYGRELEPSRSLLDLLTSLAALPHHITFRISSLEPMDCTVQIVDLIARDPRFAPHFHLPLQHASDRILRTMRRPYTRAGYAALVDRIRGLLPHASIGSDVIVGFPGETDADFGILLDYLQGSPLTHLHVFPYSDRPGTAAADLRPKVPGAVIRARSRQVREIGEMLTSRFRASQVGTIRPGLTLEDGSLVVTDNYLKVRIPPGRARNERVEVRITSAEPLVGEVVPGSGSLPLVPDPTPLIPDPWIPIPTSLPVAGQVIAPDLRQ